VPLAKARANALKIDWDAFTPTKPASPARAASRPMMSRSWFPISIGRPSSRPGSSRAAIPRYWKIRERGPAAKALFDDAQAMLKRIVEERWFTPKAGDRFWPANAIGDDIALMPASRARSGWRHSIPCVSNSRAVTARQCRARRFRRAEGTAARPITSAPSSLPPREEEKISGAMRGPMTITVRSCEGAADRLAEAFAERCTSARGVSSGLCERREFFTRRAADEPYPASVAPGYPRSPTIRKRRRFQACSTRRKRRTGVG